MAHAHHRQAGRRVAGRLTPNHLPGSRRYHHPSYEKLNSQGWRAVEAEGRLSEEGWRKEQQWALDMGLPGAECLTDRTIPTFARGELPHFAGINTFLKAPYVENVRDVGKYDAAVLGSRSTAAPPTVPAPASGRRASAASRPSTRPTTTSSASTCASR
jgi:agmatinase